MCTVDRKNGQEHRFLKRAVKPTEWVRKGVFTFILLCFYIAEKEVTLRICLMSPLVL